MYGLTSSDIQFLMGINTFITAAKAYVARNPGDQGYVYCPCRDCKNLRQFGNVEHERIKMPKRRVNWANSKFFAIIKPYT